MNNIVQVKPDDSQDVLCWNIQGTHHGRSVFVPRKNHISHGWMGGKGGDGAMDNEDEI